MVVFVKFEEILWSGSFQLIIIVDDSYVFLAFNGGLGRLSVSNRGDPPYLLNGAVISSF